MSSFSPDAATPATILVCDDEAALRALAREALAPLGHRIVETGDGTDALELARSVRPDLILLDMMMPGRSGLDVLADLRATRELARIPVVMLTARVQRDDEVAALALGAKRFVSKPFSPFALEQLVRELLDERALRNRSPGPEAGDARQDRADECR